MTSIPPPLFHEDPANARFSRFWAQTKEFKVAHGAKGTLPPDAISPESHEALTLSDDDLAKIPRRLLTMLATAPSAWRQSSALAIF